MRTKVNFILIPGAPLTNFYDGGGGGGPTEVHILYPKKSQLQNLSTQNITTFLTDPKKSLGSFLATQKIPPFFFSRPIKIPASFIDPKKSPLAKISDPKNHWDPPPIIKICKWGPWGSYCDRVILQSYTEFYHKTSILGQWKLIIWLASPPPPPRMDSVFCFIVHRRLFLTTTNNEAPKSDKIGI